MFQYMVSNRGYRGALNFVHNKSHLEIEVQPHEEQDGCRDLKVKSLKAFLKALGQVMEDRTSRYATMRESMAGQIMVTLFQMKQE